VTEDQLAEMFDAGLASVPPSHLANPESRRRIALALAQGLMETHDVVPNCRLLIIRAKQERRNGGRPRIDGAGSVTTQRQYSPGRPSHAITQNRARRLAELERGSAR
jgi:hypothetical protein